MCATIDGSINGTFSDLENKYGSTRKVSTSGSRISGIASTDVYYEVIEGVYEVYEAQYDPTKCKYINGMVFSMLIPIVINITFTSYYW